MLAVRLTLLCALASSCASSRIDAAISPVRAPGAALTASDASLPTAAETTPFVLPTPLPAQEQAADEGEGWEFLVMPYLWAVGLDGDLRLGDTEVPVEADFGDILDNFSGGGSLFFEARHGPWGLGLDATVLKLESDEDLDGSGTANAETDISLIGLDASYGLQPDGAWDIILGARFFDLDNDLVVTGMPPASGGISATHAVIGTRGRWESGNWRFNLRGDVGLGAGDIASWQALGLVGYQFGRSWGLDVGYRVLDMDVEDSGAELDTTVQGFMLGAFFGF